MNVDFNVITTCLDTTFYITFNILNVLQFYY